MSKPGEIKSIALILIGWLTAFAVLFPHGVVVCIGELAHVELGILGSACCDENSHLATALAGVSASLPDDPCSDGDHVLATSWHHRSGRDPGRSPGRHVDLQSQPLRASVATFGNLEKDQTNGLLAVSCPTPSLLLEHLSTSILLC
jgi:hypothetical protein